MEHDAWFFIGILVFIFLIWAATGGPTRPISFASPGLAQPQELGGGTYLHFPRAPFGIGGTQVSLVGSSGGGSATDSTDTPTSPLAGGSLFGTPSPYRGAISMSAYVSNASSSNASSEYVQISVAQNAGAPVNITGWKLVSEATGRAAAVARGTEVPTLGTVNVTRDIVLAPGEQALIVSGKSPIGVSFRENKCVGYFSNFQQFSPSLPQNCPVPSDELASFYGAFSFRDTACVEYVNTLPRCEAVLFPLKTLSSACKSFVVQYFNYNGCVAIHRDDADFKGNIWRVYLGRSDSLWRTRNEVVELRDMDGKTVDAFSY